MKNIITGLIILAILGTAAYYLTKEESQSSKIRTIMNDRDFTVDRKDIYKIFVARKSLEPYTLTRKSDGWYYNDDEFKVSKYVIPTVLAVFDRTQVNHIPPGPAVETILHSMRRNGIKVELYGKNDELLKTMYVGADASQSKGTYMLLEGSSQPYAMELRNIKGGFRHRLTFTENQLRDRVLLAEQPDNVERVGVHYPNDEEHSWMATRTPAGFTVTSPAWEHPEIKAAPAMMDAYLHSLDRIPLEGWEIGNQITDSIAQIEPFAVITVDVKEGQDHFIKLIPFRDFIDKEAKIHAMETSKLVTRYYIIDENGQMGIGQQRVLRDLLVGYEFFKGPNS